MKKSAFTLIELLVVISIIAILASIAVPVFSKAIEKGHATNCAANLRQLGIGTVAYLNDNEDQLFARASPWPITLHSKYVQNWKVYRCPFDKRPDREGNDAPVSYGFNSNLFDLHSSKLTSPSQLIMMAPALSQGNDLKFPDNNRGTSQVEIQPGGGAKSGTHNNRTQICVAYADGHAGAISAKDFSNASNEEGRKRWYPTDLTTE